MTHTSGPLSPLGHPDLDQLADLEAGIDVADEVRNHAAACPQCQEALAAVGKTHADVAALTAETVTDTPDARMPADVADRIDAALAKEAGAGTTGTVVPFAGREKRRGGLIAGGVAASVIAALVAVIVISSAVGNDKKGPTASGASFGANLSTSVVTASGHNYTSKTLTPNVNALLHNPVAVSNDAATAGSGTSAREAVPQPSAAAGKEARTLSAPVPQGFSALQSSSVALSQCVATLLGPRPQDQRAPLAVDLARFDGKSAAIFVFPGRDPSHLTVYVVPADGCATGIFSLFNIAKT